VPAYSMSSASEGLCCQQMTDLKKRIRGGRKVLCSAVVQERSAIIDTSSILHACAMWLLLQVSNAADPESPRVVCECVSGQVFEHDECCAAVSHAVV
jgi:hypothetical protein